MRCYKCMNEINQNNYCEHCGSINIADTTLHHLIPGTLLNNKFLIGNSIGEGGFGITYIGYDQNLNIRVAVKEYYPNGFVNRNNNVSNEVLPISQIQENFFSEGKVKFLNEARSLAKFPNEQGIVQVRDFFEENNTAYIVMEYLDGINLNEYLSKNGAMDAETVFSLMIPIMQSLEKVHENQIIHRDISPNNIMFLNNGKLKLMDFGSARYFSKENNDKSVLIHYGYAPIEQYQTDGNQGPWTDVYGLCATMYKCITLKTPVAPVERYGEDTLCKPSELGININPSLENVLMYGLAFHFYNRCQSMNELLELTTNALGDETVLLSTGNNGVYNTSTFDANYKTQLVNNFDPNNQNYVQNAIQNQNYNGQMNSYSPKKKSKKLPIILAIIVTICVMIAVGSVLLVVFKSNDNTENNNQQPDESIINTELSSENETQSSSSQELTTTTTATLPTETTEMSTTENTSTTSVLENASYFISAGASSTLPNEYQYSYKASNVLSNNDSCWCENSSDLGIGEWIKLDLPRVQKLSGLKIINGYAGTEKQYNTNSKVTDILIEFSNGKFVEKTLDVYDASDRKNVQTIEFDEPIETNYVKITIEGAEEGECKDTCLTYVAPY